MTDVFAPPAFDPGVPPPPKTRLPRWAKALIASTVVFAVVVAAGFVIRVPYSTIAPGSAVELNDKVSVEGAESFPPDGAIELLFIRERNHINLWRYVQARLDGDIELVKEELLNPEGRSQVELNQEAAQQMADAKNFATKVALEAAGYEVQSDNGLTVSGLFVDLPADKVLRLGDVILAADGKTITENEDLVAVINTHKVGEDVTLRIKRDGKNETVKVPVAADPERERVIIGVLGSPRYRFPIKVAVDTSGIGGPSAGLAMSLAILDDLTPGNLTGGQRVAVTGTIDSGGNVGPIGGIAQKAVAARSSGAKLFLVPKCSPDLEPDALQVCQSEIQQAADHAGKDVTVVPVGTFDEAVAALRDAGGDPVTRVAPRERVA
jgi:PDZ domain-containing protein